MLKRLMTAALVLLPVTVLAQPTTYEALTISTTAVGFDAATLRVGNQAVRWCSGVVESASVRLRYDGTDPTSANGILVAAGQTLIIRGFENLSRAKFIRAGDTNATLRVSCSTTNIDELVIGAVPAAVTLEGATIEVGAQPANDPHYVRGSDGTNAVNLASETTLDAILTALGTTLTVDVASGTVTVDAGSGFAQDATHDAASIAAGPQIMAEYDDTATDVVDEGDAGRLRIDARRNLYTANVATTSTAESLALPCYITSAASTNATNCKNAAGNVYGVRAVNTTSTIYYLRLYNLSAAPTCSSATGFVETIPIPHASGAGGGVVTFTTPPVGYDTGIGFCLTGGGASTDNTNAATGVYIAVLYK